jgi:adenylate kinase family enzyme
VGAFARGPRRARAAKLLKSSRNATPAKGLFVESPGVCGSPPPRRFVIIGTSGSGKTTLARAVSERLAIPHLELDSFHHGPKWTERPQEEFRACVDVATRAESWVVDGNYSFARDLIWPRAQVLVWLDLSLPVTFGRVLRRTVRRIVSQEELWNGNRESLRMAFSRESILLWCLTAYGRNRNRVPAALAEAQHSHLEVVHCRNARDAASWLRDL